MPSNSLNIINSVLIIMKKIWLLFIVIVLQVNSLRAQCTAVVEATTNSICRGANVTLNAEIGGSNINNCGRTVNMSNTTTIVDCGVGVCFYDAGGQYGSYSNSTSYTQTFTSNNGSAITIYFSSVSLENSFDELYIYDGTNVYGTLLNSGNLYNGLSGMSYTSSSGSITVRFTPDGSVTYAGWAAVISCNSCSNYTYAWSNGATGSSTNVSPNVTTTYTVTVTSANCCTATASTTITVANCENGTACPSVDVLNNINVDGDVIPVTCNNSCVTLSADVTATAPVAEHYTVSSIPYNPPFDFMSGTRIFANASDDTWGAPLPLPFGFCYYGTTYNAITPGSNSVATFNNVSQGSYCAWSYSSSIPSSGLITNAIFAAYRDILPTSSYYNPYNGNCAIYQGIIGSYPCRSYVLSYYNVPLYSCTSTRTFTTMIVLYEGTNVIDIYIRNAPLCSSWNSGYGLIGIQNANGTEGVTPPGRNTGAWSASNEAWRFTPIGEPIYSLTWYEGAGINGPVLSTDNSIEVCPTVSSYYTVRMQYTACNGDAFDLTSTVQVVLDNAIGDIAIDATRTTICEGESTTLTLTSDAVVSSYLWSNGATTQSITVSPTQTTTYTCTITTGQNCTGIASIDITVAPTPDVSISAVDSSLCLGESTVLTATATDAAQYLWNTGESTASITVTPTTNTTYSCTITSTFGCVGSNSLLITVTPLPYVTLTASPQQICEGETATLSASASQAATYVWNTGETTSAITVNPTITNNYSCTVTDIFGCSGSNNITVTVNIPPDLTISAASDTVCVQATTTLTVSGADTYSWSNGQTTSSITVGAGSYSVTATLNNCVADTSITVFEYPQLQISLSADSSSCEEANGRIVATITGTTAPYSYLWSNGAVGDTLLNVMAGSYSVTVTDRGGCTATASATVTDFTPIVTLDEITQSHCGQSDAMASVLVTGGTGNYTYDWHLTPNITTAVATGLTAGTYIVTVDDGNCTIDFQIVISEAPAPTACFTLSPSIAMAGETVVQYHNCSTNATIWFWDFGDGDNSDMSSPTHVYGNIGIYTVILVVSDAYNCTASTQLEIEVVGGTSFYMPNAFTPDGDGLNETIQPVLSNCLPGTYEFIIFDRWGRMVFRTTEIKQGWDGIYNGKKVDLMTTFVYTVHYSDIMGTPHQKIGHFVILP